MACKGLGSLKRQGAGVGVWPLAGCGALLLPEHCNPVLSKTDELRDVGRGHLANRHHSHALLHWALSGRRRHGFRGGPVHDMRIAGRLALGCRIGKSWLVLLASVLPC